MPVNCEPFEPMIFDIDLDCCIAKVLCNGLVKYAFNLGTTTIVETGVSSYRIDDGITSWSIPSDQGGSYASDIAALWDAICVCRSSGTLGEANLDRELVEICYDAIADGTGYTTGDRITRVMILDVTTDPSTIESSIYINKTTGSAITGVLGDFQVCTALGDCATPLFNISAMEPFCWNGVTIYGKRPCAPEEDPVFYDWQGNTVDVGSETPTYGGCQIMERVNGVDQNFHLVSAATTNATNIKASAGKVTGWNIYNSNAVARKLAFHNDSGSPTAGASVYFSVIIPALSSNNISIPAGIDFPTGIAITTVTGLADTDTTAVALNDLVINIFWK